jgi:hypothetical protein
MYLPDDLPSRVVFLSPTCDITVTDVDLNFKNTLQSENQRQVLLKSFIFSLTSCLFLSSRIPLAHGSVVLSIFAVDDHLHVEVVAIGEDDGFVRLGDCKLPLDTSDTISGISCSNSGHITVLSMFRAVLSVFIY